MRNCVGAAACLSGLGSHTGRPRNKLSNASSSGLKRVMFSIVFSSETSNQSAVDDCASVADWVVYGGDTANYYVCEPKYFMKQTGHPWREGFWPQSLETVGKANPNVAMQA